MDNKIRELRTHHKMTQAELAEAMEISRSLVGKLENGQIPLKADQLKRLSELFNVSTDYIMGMSLDPSPVDKKRKPTAIDDNELSYLISQDGLESVLRLLLELSPEQRKKAEELMELLLLQQRTDKSGF